MADIDFTTPLKMEQIDKQFDNLMISFDSIGSPELIPSIEFTKFTSPVPCSSRGESSRIFLFRQIIKN